ncbi:MAG: hypothetical protein U0270_36005 [Labilithrix sp.]
MRALVLVALATACAPAAPRAKPVPVTTQASAPDAGLADMTPAKGADVPSLDELAARGATDAPMMREVRRLDGVSKPTDLEAGASDACFRAVVAASAPVKAWFIDATHAPRGEIAETAGLVPPRGPVCAKKGETLRLVVHATTAGTTARAVVWQSP